MELEFYHFLIVCPLVFLSGFIDAIAGGGGLISLPAYMLTGLPVHYAIGTNKMSAMTGTAVATVRYIKQGYVPKKLGVVSVLMGLVGAAIGANITLMLSDAIFKKIMLVIVPVTAYYVLKSADFVKERPQLSNRETFVKTVVLTFLLGIYDGFYGPGMGTFLLILLNSWVDLNIRTSNGILKVMNATTSTTSFIIYFMNGKSILLLGFVASFFSIFGNYLGAKYFEKGELKIVKPLMLTVLGIFFVKLVAEVFQIF